MLYFVWTPLPPKIKLPNTKFIFLENYILLATRSRCFHKFVTISFDNLMVLVNFDTNYYIFEWFLLKTYSPDAVPLGEMKIYEIQEIGTWKSNSFRYFDDFDDFWCDLGQFWAIFGSPIYHLKLQRFWSKHRELVKGRRYAPT